MAIPFASITDFQPAQLPPALSGLLQGMNFAQQYQAGNLANQIKQIQAQFLPQGMQADLAYKQAQTSKVPYDIAQIVGNLQRIPSQIKLANAQADLANLKSTNPALNLSGEAQQIAVANNWLNSGDPAKIQQGNMLLDSIKAGIQNKAALAGYHSISGLTPAGKSIVEQNRLTGANQISNIPAGAGATTQGIGIIPTSLSQGQNVQQTPQTSGGMTADQQMNMLTAEAQKHTSDPATRAQSLAFGALQNEFSAWDQEMPNIVKFAGLQGLGNKTIQGLLSNIGAQSSDYDKYNNFVNTGSKAIADQIRKALGTSVRTDYVEKYILPLANPLTAPNPQMATQRWEWLRNWLNEYSNTYGSAISSGVPVKSALEKNPNIYSRPPTFQEITKYSQDDLEYTAKTHNISVDEVKRRLGVS